MYDKIGLNPPIKHVVTSYPEKRLRYLYLCDLKKLIHLIHKTPLKVKHTKYPQL